MAEIFPFQAYRYNTARVDPARVLTQPYDKITPEMQERYSAASPYNLITIEKGRALPDDTPEKNVYTRARRALEEWIAQGVLMRDPAPALYTYFQDYSVPGSGERRTRKGFIALTRLVDYAAGIVHRHEQTLAGPKADRLELLRQTRAHTGQLFLLYADPARSVDALLDAAASRPAATETRDEYDVVHRLWLMTDEGAIARFRAALADKRLVIADGHHRYETALAYRNESRMRLGRVDPGAPHEKVMATLFNTHAEGLTILPTHRVVANVAGFDYAAFRRMLEPHFEWRSFAFANPGERAARYAEFRGALVGMGRERRAVGIYAGRGGFDLLLLRPEVNLAVLLPDVSPAQRQLDVVLLHRLVLEKGLGITAEAVVRERNLTYEREMDAAIAAVGEGRAQLCGLLNAVRVEQVMEMALGGEVLPQKSTDFYPKLLSGLTIDRLDS